MTRTAIMLVLFWPSGFGSALSAAESDSDDLTIVLTQGALTRFAEACTPLKMQGTHTATVNAPVVGTVSVRVPWTAVVTDPAIRVEADGARFEAQVTITASGLTYNDKITGTLDPTYDAKSNQMRIKIKDAAVPLKLPGGAASVKMDISDQLPSWGPPISLPPSELQVEGRTVRVKMNPRISYERGKVLVSTSLNFEGRPGGATSESGGGQPASPSSKAKSSTRSPTTPRSKLNE